MFFFFFFQAEDGIRDGHVTGVQTCALPIFVIDALDECGHSGAREELLRVLASESLRLPPTIHIFITSRAERDIRSAFSASPHTSIHEIDIKLPTNKKDVQTYIVGSFLRLAWKSADRRAR